MVRTVRIWRHVSALHLKRYRLELTSRLSYPIRDLITDLLVAEFQQLHELDRSMHTMQIRDKTLDY